ncbi:MAG: hypothetical protein RL013_391 [Bacteroidota bacterium]
MSEKTGLTPHQNRILPRVFGMKTFEPNRLSYGTNHVCLTAVLHHFTISSERLAIIVDSG